ncbi:DNA oxidative demethylase ALKBH2 [Halyomorpha halys]|uniref:DNA oxidative demethylase ALKBH2 n=1 Tax=Halyomorpha halys TaxID=286706 RepID=UPI0006D50966|nr:DNA oxidative demethylase ALKBH2 [Halyomorpha halys]
MTEDDKYLSPNWKEIKSTGLNLLYSSKFLNKKFADELLFRLDSEIKYFTGDLSRVKVFGKWHNIPRQQAAFGDEGLTYKFSSLSVPALPWPECLVKLRNEISKCLGTDYNFVLVNRYRNGNDYIGEHRDDEKELDEEAGIVSISLGATRDFVLRHSETRKKGSASKISKVTVPLEHGSCLVMKWPTNHHWYHSLPRRKGCLHVRINLTFRKVKR